MGVWQKVIDLTRYMRSTAREVVPYRSPPRTISEALIEDLPLLRSSTVEQMLADPQVAIGTLVRDGLLSALEVEPEDGPVDQVKWAIDQWEKIWHDHGDMLMRAKIAGWGGYGVRWTEKNGPWEVESLCEYHPRDVVALAHNGEPVGLQLRKHSDAIRNIFAPRSLWVTHRARYGRMYGDTYLRAAYLPWYKKWMEHGCEKQTTLYMLKCSVLGEIIWYPPGRLMQKTDGTQILASEVMREVMENRMSFGIAALPMLKDTNGEKEVEYQPPQGIQGDNPFEWWADDLGRSIWKGMGLLPEVVEAAGTGSFSGRSVPFVGLLSLLYGEAKEIFHAVRRDILEPGCWMNFGRPMFRLRPKPLTETYKDDMGGGGEGGGMGGGGQQPTMRPNMAGNAPPRQVQFGERFGELIDDRVPVQFDDASGQWITIGARMGDDGKRHGGSPVLIRDGRIVSGPPALRGRRINALDKPAEPDPPPKVEAPKNPDMPKRKSTPTHTVDPVTGKRKKIRTAQDTGDTGESRLEYTLRTTAEEFGIKPNVLKDAVNHVWNAKAEAIKSREELKRQLRADTGLSQADFARISNSGGDYTKIPRIDEIAQEAARSYPELGLGDPDDKNTNFAANLWAVISEGRIGPEGRAGPPAKHSSEIMREAVDLVLKSEKTDKYAEWDDVEFSLQFADDDAFGALHPRDKSGRPMDRGHLATIVANVKSGKLSRDKLRAHFGDEVYFAIRDYLDGEAAAKAKSESPEAKEIERLRNELGMREAQVRQLESRANGKPGENPEVVSMSEERPRDSRGRFLSAAAIAARTDLAANAIVSDVKARVMSVLHGRGGILKKK